MDYSFEIKNSNHERVAFRSITSTTKTKVIDAVNEIVAKNPHLKNNGHTCTIASFDWKRGKKLCKIYNL